MRNYVWFGDLKKLRFADAQKKLHLEKCGEISGHEAEAHPISLWLKINLYNDYDRDYFDIKPKMQEHETICDLKMCDKEARHKKRFDK